jgi:ABC-type hemin transport system substrate-binding protein
VIRLVLVALIGCATPPLEPTDRLISLSPAITETLGALGALDRVVGRSDWCVTPAEVLDRPALGSALTPNLEGIAALLPATVLLDGSFGSQGDALRRMTPVEQLPWLTVREVAGSVRRLGALTDRADRAEALALRLERLDVPASGPPVLLAMDGDLREVWYIKRNSLHGAALHAAGATNTIDRDVAGAPTLSTEALVALDPTTVILLVPAALDDAGRQQRLATWATLPIAASRRGRVGVVSGALVMSTGPAIVDLVDALKAELARLGPP